MQWTVADDIALEELLLAGGCGNVISVLKQHRAEMETNRKECRCPTCGRRLNDVPDDQADNEAA